MKNLILLAILIGLFSGCNRGDTLVPVGVELRTESIKRLGYGGDNWCITWAADGSQVTSMCDGDWLQEVSTQYHNHLYRILGDADNFTKEDIPNYPQFIKAGEGWFGYGVCAINGTIYSLVSRTQGANWSGPFRGIKMLKSKDNGKSWSTVSKSGKELPIDPLDEVAREDLSPERMLFMEDYGRNNHGGVGYPFAFCSFVQQGQDHSAAPDEYVYIYSPEGSQTNQLLLARMKSSEVEKRDAWEYFSSWNGNVPVWTKDINKREPVHVFPESNAAGEYFGWYSWLPSVVWNKGLGLYIMVNGGTYAGRGMTNSSEDFYSGWVHTKTGSLGFWYSENPYGPWKQFFYTDYWTIDEENRTYQPKLSPKWISEDGKKMILIWSDAMKNEEGKFWTKHYLWNQMEIEILVDK